MESFEWDPAFESGVDLPAFSSVPCSPEGKQLFTELSGAPLQTRRHDVLPTQVMTPPVCSDPSRRVEPFSLN